MANMASITVKKADGTTDVVYIAAVPSAGDKSPAIWTQNAFSGVQSNRPRFELLTQFNGQRAIRQVKLKYDFPSVYTEANTGLQKLNGSVGFNGVLYLPVQLTTTEWKEAFAQLGNLLCATLIRQSVEEGFAPT